MSRTGSNAALVGRCGERGPQDRRLPNQQDRSGDTESEAQGKAEGQAMTRAVKARHELCWPVPLR
jgi:hypothetical protein